MTTRDPHVRIVNVTSDCLVSKRARSAAGAWSRMVGLLGREAFGAEDGLLLIPSSGVHTFGMHFPIDIVALDSRNKVLGAWPNVPPGRLAGLHWKARSVLELPAGHILLSSTMRGDQLVISPAPEA